MRNEKTHAPEPGGGMVTRTACGRDLNPSCGSYGSHSAVPRLSSAPTCKACARVARRQRADREYLAARERLRTLFAGGSSTVELRVAQGQHPTGNGIWRMPGTF